MKTHLKRAIFAVVFVSSIFSLCQAAVQYSITDLGTLGGNNSWAYSINNSGQVVGESYLAGDSDTRAFLYDGTEMIDLGTLGGNWSKAHGINDSGQIVGGSWLAVYASHAFLYDGTEMFDLGTLGGNWSRAYGINDSGQVVGYSKIAGDSANHAFLYDGTEMIDLGTLGGNDSTAYAINNSGQVVGSSLIAGDSAYHAFLYDGTEMIDLGTLGGNLSTAHGINDSGQVVGGSSLAGDSVSHAFLYDGTEMIDLGTLGGNWSTARGINDSGQVVGKSYLAGDSVSHLFLYEGGVMYDLNNLIPSNSGWELGEALGINSSDQIVGSGDIGGGTHAYLLTPVPEPVIEVAVDIKPESCPNPVNVKSKGMLPVAILGTEEFEVSTIDVASIFLNGVPAIRSSYEDVATPVADPNECECTTDGSDGFDDLILKFYTQQIVETLGEVNHGDVLELSLTGVSDETVIEGADCVLIKGMHRSRNKGDINGDGVVNSIDLAIVAENWLESSIVEE